MNGLNVSADDIEIIMLKAGIENRMSVVLKGMTQNVTEGGFSVSWNMDAVKLFYNALCNELGKPNVLFSRPKIRNKSNIW